MAAFDRTVVCEATPQQVWEAAHGSLITFNVAQSTPGRLVIATDDRLGYVCLIASRVEGKTHLRLMVDRAETVRQALSAAATPRAMLEALAAAPSQLGMAGPGLRLLNQIQQAAEETARATGTPLTADPAPAADSFTPRADPFAAPRTAAAPSTPPAESFGPADPAAPTPWDPDRLRRLWSGLAGVPLGINWRRLGKPGWAWPTILPALGLLIAVVVVGGLLLATPSHVVTDHDTVILIVLLIVGTGASNLVVALSVAELQRPAYRLWKQTRGDRQALLALDYPVGKVFLKHALIVGGIAVAVGIVLFFQTRPRDFEGGGLRLTYPSAWHVYASDGVEACADGSCVVILTRETPASVSSTIWVFHYPTPFQDSKDLREAAWDYTLDVYYPDATLIAGESRTVGGYPAAGHTYYATDEEAYCDQQAYLEDLFVIVEGEAYELQLWTPCGETFERERAEFHDVLDSITFSVGQEQVQAGSAALVWAGP